MPCKTLNAWRRVLPEARFVNMYGPTEITDVCTWFPVERDFADTDVLPIGYACANTRVMLIDGEICVTGTCLSPGYYNAPEKTAEVFVPNPLRTGVTEMMYKTGDLGVYNERGELMFLGRKDSQIKRAGYRMELGEVEVALRQVPGWENGLVIYDKESGKLACFWTGPLTKKEIMDVIKKTLPRYALPDTFIHLEEMPYTATMKIDRQKLRSMI